MAEAPSVKNCSFCAGIIKENNTFQWFHTCSHTLCSECWVNITESPKELIQCPICTPVEKGCKKDADNESSKKLATPQDISNYRDGRIESALKLIEESKQETRRNIEDYFDRLVQGLQDEKNNLIDSLDNSMSNFSNYLIQLAQNQQSDVGELKNQLRNLSNKQTVEKMFSYRSGSIESIINPKIIGELSIPDEFFEKPTPIMKDISNFIAKSTCNFPRCTWFFVNEDGIYSIATSKNFFSGTTSKIIHTNFKTATSETIYRTKKELGMLFVINEEVLVYNVKDNCIHLGLNSGDVIEQKISTFSAALGSSKTTLITCLSLDKQTVWLYKGKHLIDIFHLIERIENVFPMPKGDIVIVKDRKNTVFWFFKTTETVVAIFDRTTKEIKHEFTTVQQKLLIRPTITGGILALGSRDHKIYSLKSDLRIDSVMENAKSSFIFTPTHSKVDEFYAGNCSGEGGSVCSFSHIANIQNKK